MRVYNNYLTGGQLGFQTFELNWHYIHSCFTEDEVMIIKELKKNYNFGRGVTVGRDEESTHSEVRESETFFMEQDEVTQWIYDRIAWHVSETNKEKWNFDLVGMEKIQYTKYTGANVLKMKDKFGIRTHRDGESNQGDHYDWHIDGGTGVSNRKISIAVQLTPSGEYEGGDLKTNFSDGIISHGKTMGSCVIFPSFILHKVEPIIEGIRESLVCWIHGPTFR